MTMAEHDNSYETFRTARDHLLLHRDDHDAAVTGYRSPELAHFNWALDWFDVVAASGETGPRPALWVVEEDGVQTKLTYADLARRSAQLAAWLQACGARRGDRLLLMLGNQVELWETMLACIKLGVVVIPATTLLRGADLADRIDRGHVAHVVARSEDVGRFEEVHGSWTPIAVGPDVEGWLSYGASYQHLETFTPEVPTRSDEPLLLYFTSGTTARPKLVEHSHVSYRSGTCRRCTGSACSQATSTSTSARRDGPSTPGATCSHRGTPRRRCSSSTKRGSPPSRCWNRWLTVA